MDAIIPLFFLFFVFCSVGIGLLTAAFWIWMLIDCVMHESDEGNDKLVWVLIIIFTQLIGALIYFFVRRRQRQGKAAVKPPELQP